MFLQVGHEGGAARSYSRRIARVGLMLAVNVTVGISDVNLAKLREQIDTGAIGCPEIGTTKFAVADKAGEQRPTEIIAGLLQRAEEQTMARGHIVPHFLEVDSEGVRRMGDAEPGVEAWHNGALRAGFAAELLGFAGIGLDALVDESVRE